MKLTKILPVLTDFSPAEVAEMFCLFDANEQAQFFNSIAEHVKLWDGTFHNQMFEVTKSAELTREGDKIMRTIGDYSV